VGVEYVSVVNVQVAVDIGERATLGLYDLCPPRAIRLERSFFSNTTMSRSQDVQKCLQEGWNNHRGTVAVTRLKKSDPSEWSTRFLHLSLLEVHTHPMTGYVIKARVGCATGAQDRLLTRGSIYWESDSHV